MSNRKEYGKRCQRCWQYKQSRMYYEPIHGEYKRLCRKCWNMIDTASGRRNANADKIKTT